MFLPKWKELNEIVPGVYISCWATSQDLDVLQSKNITHVVNACSSSESFKQLKYLCVQVQDDPHADIQKYFTQSSRFIHQARLKGDGVLVHCFAGISRSPCLVVAYLVQKLNYSLAEALKLVQAKRSICDINPGFLQQLHDLKNKN